ncbi:MAG: GNAT family N-acetyltransferase [Cellulosilyticaceae bacterium]
MVNRMITINLREELSEEEEMFVEHTHEVYEQEKGVNCNYTPFYFTAEADNEVLGVISGYTCYEEVYIDDLVVARVNRNKGIGRQLLENVEHHFTHQGFNNMNLVTNAFQAPEFYKKCGFELEYIRRNSNNSKLDKYFFVKYFK